MWSNFYEARLSEDNRIILVKDKAVNYKVEKLNAPDKIAKMMRELLYKGKAAEEYCYMITLDSVWLDVSRKPVVILNCMR